jgi:hypothetical protein
MSQFTTNTQNDLHLNLYTHGHPFKGAGVIVNSVTGIKYGLEKTLYFQFEMNTVEILTAPTD